ncbi:hypothetical protein A3A95_02390 [Candidatus Nomurabacteria bacterium RIFCSPLOWO2_01_FULL_39_18]|uniref:CYTH domain-containing protein n=1 Tax=Candidatus Nomurabacteria bacterium RIFCSPHIGHO2_01_FULL_40_24b TaxID=1801739 RepID=A0A1F6V5T1_9BACT|nr:MAG: hypothetical protein A2647_02145 [Candidatus Nomurabacteria bacterium RIFCSPHIGHO2_01_FULL_40_24b]OGI90708.1 MAG: hypothetical protein A3A95_02390 [Candidatus Nomurabacteria bacterium RIFCSPLOWO2_01_FULL_39_18]
MEEFEITFLEVDVPKLEKKLAEISAEKVGEYDYRRALFDYPDFRMNRRDRWLRLRTNGKEITLAYKESVKGRYGDNAGMKEIEVIVDDYEKTYELLKSIRLVIKREEENKKIRYRKGKTVFDIDSWPEIPTYLEVESTSIKEAQNSAQKIGLDPKDGLIFSAKEGYLRYGINIDDYSSITFKGMRKK